jgi:CorA-like Mg2+ transporter protein
LTRRAKQAAGFWRYPTGKPERTDLKPSLSVKVSAERRPTTSRGCRTRSSCCSTPSWAFISIQQNDLFKILTIVSVVGVPPTIMVGIWGMNFKFMPELSWIYGYPFAWLAVIASGVLPLIWFKWRGWFD